MAICLQRKRRLCFLCWHISILKLLLRSTSWDWRVSVPDEPPWPRRASSIGRGYTNQIPSFLIIWMKLKQRLTELMWSHISGSTRLKGHVLCLLRTLKLFCSHPAWGPCPFNKPPLTWASSSWCLFLITKYARLRVSKACKGFYLDQATPLLRIYSQKIIKVYIQRFSYEDIKDSAL